MDELHTISTCLGRLWVLRSILVASLLANMAEEEVAALVVNNGSGVHSTGFAGISCTSRCVHDDCQQVGMHTVRSVHNRCFDLTVSLGILDITLQYFQ